MGTAERRHEIMRILCRRRKETVHNLAAELNVSPRTIERDIEILSLTEPIYTKCGRYGGGVYVVDEYSMDRMYMSDSEIGVLQKLYGAVQESGAILTYEERHILETIIMQYSKPKTKKKG